MTAYKKEVDELGEQLGINARKGETYPEYESRLKREKAERQKPMTNVLRLPGTPQGNRSLTHIPPDKRKFAWQWYWVTDERLSPQHRLILHTLSMHMRTDGTNCYPSLELICEEAGYSYKSISRASKILKEIEGFGWIKIQRRGLATGGRASNLYEPRLPEGWQE